MSDSVISIEGLSKSYLLGHQVVHSQGYETLRETVTRGARRLGRAAMDMARGRQIIQGDVVEEFWALKDISFDVKQGEVVGIIGRNGAGKSTLLKILSRITEPTKGRVRIRGRVASLLEVGTGFHPELNGRENVYLNGAILGMTRSEIKAKFDEIVDFAEVEKFLDTPVKRYSSGMYVRLAFAVAAYLEPEILVVDEVLSVGDAEFQRKCLGKMSEVASGGRTVLFVSHNLSTLRSICSRGILLKAGQLVEDAGISQTLKAYTSGSAANAREYGPDSAIRRVSAWQADDCIMLEMEYASIAGKLTFPCFQFVIHDADGRPLMGHNALMQSTGGEKWSDSGIIRVRMTSPRLLDGAYSVSVALGDYYTTIFSDPNCLTLHIAAHVKANYQLPVEKVGPVFPSCEYEFFSSKQVQREAN
jgi:lipopolysaccharide transport system ATP-binding protein